MPARRPGQVRAPVGEPAVVGAQPGEPQPVLLGARHQRDQPAAREERRHRVGVHDLAGDAVGLERGVAHGVVPVAVRVGAHEVAERVHVGVGPAVELVVVGRLEERPVVAQVGAGVAVGRDHHVAVVGGRAHASTSWSSRGRTDTGTAVITGSPVSGSTPVDGDVSRVTLVTFDPCTIDTAPRPLAGSTRATHVHRAGVALHLDRVAVGDAQRGRVVGMQRDGRSLREPFGRQVVVGVLRRGDARAQQLQRSPGRRGLEQAGEPRQHRRRRDAPLAVGQVALDPAVELRRQDAVRGCGEQLVGAAPRARRQLADDVVVGGGVGIETAQDLEAEALPEPGEQLPRGATLRRPAARPSARGRCGRSTPGCSCARAARHPGRGAWPAP